MSIGAGVYQIVNKATGRRYVGQSRDTSHRIGEHFRALAGRKHHCSRLQRAFNRYGRDAFACGVLELCPTEQLNAVEQKYLDAGFALGTLYNTARVAEAPARGAKRSQRTLRIMSTSRRRLWRDPAFRERMELVLAAARPKMSAALRGRAFSPSHLESLSRAQLRRFAKQEELESLRAAQRKRSAAWLAGVADRGRKWRSNAVAVANHNAAIARRSNDPEWRATIAARNRSPGMRQKVKEFWAALKADPVAYAEFIAKRQAAKKVKS